MCFYTAYVSTKNPKTYTDSQGISPRRVLGARDTITTCHQAAMGTWGLALGPRMGTPSSEQPPLRTL